MTDLSDFDITKRWPASDPEKIQLYSIPTSNGVKVSIMLEECGLPYEAHFVGFGDEGTGSPEFISLNPNNKIPAIIDPNGPGGKPFGLWESGAILMYLADKTGRFIPTDETRRWETIQWLFFQMAGIGPMFGQFGFFHKFGGKDMEDKLPLNRYASETKRLLGVLDKQLDGRDWIMGDDYTIADIATLGWVRTIPGFFEAEDITEFRSFKNVAAWLDRGLARPAVEKGLAIPARPS